MSKPKIKFKLIAFLLLALSACYRETNIQLPPQRILLTNNVPTTNMVVEPAWCESCENWSKLKVVTDGKEFGIRMPNGNVHALKWKTCQEVEKFITDLISEERSSCRKCSPKQWKDVDCP